MVNSAAADSMSLVVPFPWVVQVARRIISGNSRLCFWYPGIPQESFGAGGCTNSLRSMRLSFTVPQAVGFLRYEFLTSIHNAGITLNSNLQNLFVPIFNLHGIAQDYFPTARNPHPPQELYNSRMARATYFTSFACKWSVELSIIVELSCFIWFHQRTSAGVG